MLRELHKELGIPEDYGLDGGPPAFTEASELVEIGPNLVGRMQRLTPVAAERWDSMVSAATADSVMLLIVSGFRTSPKLQLRMSFGLARVILTEP